MENHYAQNFEEAQPYDEPPGRRRVPAKSSSGAVKWVLIGCGAIMLVMVGCGVFVALNLRNFTATAVESGMEAVLTDMEIPAEEREEIMKPVRDFAEQPGPNRVALVIASLFAAGGYTLIVYLLISGMVRGFDQTVRKLSGTS